MPLPTTQAAKSFRPAPAVDTQKDVSKQSLATQEHNTAENTSVYKNTEGSHHDFSRISVFAEKQNFIQPKLTINTPGDAYEQEADNIDRKSVV